MTKTTLANEDVHQAAMNSWCVVDASGQTLGRMATQVATILMGKHRPDYTPNVLVGEGVIVVNASGIRLTGTKAKTREYTRWTGYQGGLRVTTMGDFLEKNPENLVRTAVRRMLPKNKLAKHMIARLKVYRGAEHPHVAQQPQAVQPLGADGQKGG
jgi:large subunit ribosomal protein L13